MKSTLIVPGYNSNQTNDITGNCPVAIRLFSTYHSTERKMFSCTPSFLSSSHQAQISCAELRHFVSLYRKFLKPKVPASSHASFVSHLVGNISHDRHPAHRWIILDKRRFLKLDFRYNQECIFLLS